MRMTATIAVPAPISAAAVKASLSSSLGTAADASAALGIIVESDPTIAVELSDTSSDKKVPVVPIVVGIVVAICLLCLFACCCYKWKQSKNPNFKQVVLNNPNAGGAAPRPPGRKPKKASKDTGRVPGGYQMDVKDHASLGANQA